jgi:hypothetical protein
VRAARHRVAARDAEVEHLEDSVAGDERGQPWRVPGTSGSDLNILAYFGDDSDEPRARCVRSLLVSGEPDVPRVRDARNDRRRGSVL